MTLAYDMVVAGVIFCISVVVHLMAVELFAPGTPLHAAASEGVHMSGAERADLWYEIFALWIPLLGCLTSGLWPLLRAYRRQASTAARRGR